MSWLSGIPILIALPLFAVVFAAVTVTVHTMLRRVLPSQERLSEHHEVPGFLMGVVGVLYSVVLGFLVGTVWTSFAAAQQTADLEAGYVGDAFNYAAQLPPPQRLELQRIIARYALTVRDENWSVAPNLRSDKTANLLYRAVAIAVKVPNAGGVSSGEVLEGNTIRAALIDTLRQLGDTRRLRLVQAETWLPPGLIEALLLGATGVITFTFLFGVRSYTKQMIMTGLVAGSIGLFFGLIVELSTPYSGAIHVSRDAMRFVISNNQMESYAR